MAYYRCVQYAEEKEIPSGYIKALCLTSTGTQYIDLDYGFYPTDALKLVCVNSVYGENGADNSVIAPSVWNNNDNRFWLAGNSGDSHMSLTQYFGIAYGNISTKGLWLSPYVSNDGTAVHTHTYADKIFMIDGTSSYDASSITFGSETKNLRLFYGYNSPTASSVYSFKHVKNGVTVCNLIPCLDTAKTPCMYDTVSKKTFYNAGSGSFSYTLIS